jgi:MFS family permease
VKLPSRDIQVLAVGQALSSTVVSLLTTVSSLAGAMLAPHPALSTVPVMATVAGTLAMIYPASMIMARLGRRSGFMLKAVLGAAGSVAGLAGLAAASFWLFVLGTLLLGLFNSFSQYYRFAAIDAAPAPQDRAGAMATVTAAGVVGGVAGPFLAAQFPSLGLPAVYSNAFVALLLLCGLLGASQAFLSPALGRRAAAPAPGGPASPSAASAAAPPAAPPAPSPAVPPALLKRPAFLYTSLICAAGFSIMTLTMNAAPLSMKQCGIQLPGASLALQVHFASMYLPSLFNPLIVRRIGAAGLVRAGILLYIAGGLLAALAGENLALYIVELGLSGIGWNFMFNGGTLLLADTYAEHEKARAQGLNSLLVYGANLLASLAAGVLLAYYSWQVVNAICLPLLGACLWLLGRAGLQARPAPGGAGTVKG